jgi:tetratricopeptide (TPR) repeat protein
LTEKLVWTACLANVNGATGRLRESYEKLRGALSRSPIAEPKLGSWVSTSLAEMATRAGMMSEAEAHFRAALTLAPADYYLLGAYADYLLDSGRPQDVVALLRDKIAADPLLLRYALALQAQNANDLAIQVQQLVDRFAASRLRGDRVHLQATTPWLLSRRPGCGLNRRLIPAKWQFRWVSPNRLGYRCPATIFLDKSSWSASVWNDL